MPSTETLYDTLDETPFAAQNKQCELAVAVRLLSHAGREISLLTDDNRQYIYDLLAVDHFLSRQVLLGREPSQAADLFEISWVEANLHLQP